MKQKEEISQKKDWWIEHDFYGRALFCFNAGKKLVRYPARYISQAFKLNCFQIIRPDRKPKDEKL